jgi:protein-L-isoaspartate(D-aspartate) O-methyltransferase
MGNNSALKPMNAAIKTGSYAPAFQERICTGQVLDRQKGGKHMMDYQAARTKMVDNQIRTTDVTSYSVLKAFLTVPKEAFVPEKLKPFAYIDSDIEIAPKRNGLPARYIMEPSPMAKLLQLAEIRPTDSVLEIGGGTGYGAAILGQLAGTVLSVESDAELAETASSTQVTLGYGNVSVVTGELSKGFASKGPYDVIFVHGSVDELPEALFTQLADGGRLVVVLGQGNASRAHLYVKDGHNVSERPSFNTSVKPLPGFSKVVEFVF